jgi:hypothetical protein
VNVADANEIGDCFRSRVEDADRPSGQRKMIRGIEYGVRAAIDGGVSTMLKNGTVGNDYRLDALPEGGHFYRPLPGHQDITGPFRRARKE